MTQEQQKRDEQQRDALYERFLDKVDPWFKHDAYGTGKYTIEALIDSEKYYFVGLLDAGDVYIVKESDANKERQWEYHLKLADQSLVTQISVLHQFCNNPWTDAIDIVL